MSVMVALSAVFAAEASVGIWAARRLLQQYRAVFRSEPFDDQVSHGQVSNERWSREALPEQ